MEPPETTNATAKVKNPMVGVHAVYLDRDGHQRTVQADNKNELNKLLSGIEMTSDVLVFKGKRLNVCTKTNYKFS